MSSDRSVDTRAIHNNGNRRGVMRRVDPLFDKMLHDMQKQIEGELGVRLSFANLTRILVFKREKGLFKTLPYGEIKALWKAGFFTSR